LLFLYKIMLNQSQRFSIDFGIVLSFLKHYFMKKLPVLVLLFLCSFLTANAQRYADLDATLLSPLPNDTIITDESFDIVLKVINKGPDTLRVDDTAQLVLEFDGSPILFSIGGGPSIPYLPYVGADINPGDTALVGISFTLFSGWDLGTTNFCARFIPFNGADPIQDTILTNNGGCANVLVSDGSTAVYNVKQTNQVVSVYPNPAKDMVHIKTTLIKPEQLMLSIVNIMGQTVLKQDLGLKASGQQDIPVNINQLPKGIYGYQLMIGAEVQKGKLQVE